MTDTHDPKPKMGTASDGRPMHYSAGAIIEDPATGEFLLLDRKFPPLGFAGMAGHVDEGEDPLTAVHREGREELGTEIFDVVLLAEAEVPWNTCRHGDVHHWYLYQARVDRAKVRVDPHEAKGWGWFTREQLKDLNIEPVWKLWFTLRGIL